MPMFYILPKFELIFVFTIFLLTFFLATRFSCDTCGKNYKYKAGLYAHKKHECGKEPSFRCPHCEFRAKYKSGLKAHIISKHAFFYGDYQKYF